MMLEKAGVFCSYFILNENQVSMKKNKILIFLSITGILFYLSIECKAQDFTPNNTNTVTTGTAADTAIPGGQVLQQGTAVQTSIPGGNLSPSSNGSAYQNQEVIPGSTGPTADFVVYLKQVIGFGYATIGILAMFMLSVGAYQYLMAAGNLAKVESAKETIGSALLGLVLGLMSFVILWTINPDIVSLRGINLAGLTASFPSSSTSSMLNTNLGGVGCAGVVSNINSMAGSAYVPGSNDCSSTTSRAYTNAGCQNPGGTTSEMYSNAVAYSGNPSTLKAGDALVWNNGSEGHVGICLTNGCDQIMGASSAKGIHPSSGSSMYSNPNVRVIQAAQYCPSC